MEHIYTIKVKRQFDPRGLYPSERRYSASTVRGLAWVHGVLAATCALLATLVLLNPALQRSLALPPGLLAAGAVAACLAAGLASRRWYIDRNITLFFVCSLVSTFLSIAALSLIVSRVVSAEEGSAVFGDFFTSENLEGRVQLVSGEVGDVEMENATMEANQTWIYIIKVPLEDLKQQNIPLLGEEPTYRKSHKVLSINILIAAAVEMLWSIISVALAWRGMRSDYPDGDPQDRRGPTVQVVTELKGNNTRHLPKNTRILPPRPDLIQHHHHPRCDKIRKFFRSQRESGGLFLQTGDQLVLESQSQQLPSRESSAQYRERMLTFLNGEAKTQEMKPQDTANSEITTISKSDTSKIGSPEDSLQSDSLNTTAKTECHPKFEAPPDRLSWGDVREYPVYDQNTLDLDKIRLTFERRKAIDAEKKKKLEESVSKVTEPNKEDIQHQEAQE